MRNKMLISAVDNYFIEFSHMLSTISKEELANIATLLIQAEVAVFCGNGGSYATATHMAGDLLMNTKIKANTFAIGDNMVSFTACSNDMCYEDVFAVELEKRTCKCNGLKTIFLISTSGKSKNILKVGKKAKELGFYVVSLVGANTANVKKFSDIVVSIDSEDAGFLEAAHGFIGHILVRLVRRLLDETVC